MINVPEAKKLGSMRATDTSNLYSDTSFYSIEGLAGLFRRVPKESSGGVFSASAPNRVRAAMNDHLLEFRRDYGNEALLHSSCGLKAPLEHDEIDPDAKPCCNDGSVQTVEVEYEVSVAGAGIPEDFTPADRRIANEAAAQGSPINLQGSV